MTGGRERSGGPPDALLLDLDGTLADSVYVQVAAWQSALASQGVAIPGWRVHHLLGRGLGAIDEELERRLLPPVSPEVARALGVAHGAAIGPLLEGVGPCPGAGELSEAVERLGVPTAVVTGGGREVAEWLLGRAVGHTRWEIVVAGGDVAAKPAPDSIELAARRLGVDVGGCWFVGDSVWDMQAATAAGASAIGVLTGGRSAAELRGAGAKEVFEDVGGVAALLAARAGRPDAAVADLEPATIATLADFGRSAPSSMTHLDIHALGGAHSREPSGGAAYNHRGARFVYNLIATWPPADLADPSIDHTRRAHAAITEIAGDEAYVNYLAEDESARISQAFDPPTLERLQRVKTTYDPANVFRRNHNIPPASGG